MPQSPQPEDTGWVLIGAGGASIPTVTGAPNLTYVDKSGIINAGGSAQSLAGINTSRKYFFFKNNSITPLGICFTGSANGTGATGTILIDPASTDGGSDGGYYESVLPSGQAVSVFGPTGGKTFTCLEG